MTPSAVSIVIPCHRDEPTAVACLDAILQRTRHPDWEVILVTDPEADPVLERYASQPRVRILRVPHGNVARAINAGMVAAGQRDVVRVHADVVVESDDWLEQLAAAAASAPKAGVVGARLVYPDGRIHSEGRSLVSGVGFHVWHRNRKAYQPDGPAGGKVQEVDGVPGALAYYRREAITAVGGLDERFGRAWIEDDDFCIGVRAKGFKVYVHPGVRGVHYTRCWAPSSQNPFPDAEPFLRHMTWQGRHAGELRLARIWEAKWGWDPFYPDLHEIRRLFGRTEIAWQIGDAMRYRASSDTPVVDCCLVTWNNLALLRRTLESLALTDYPVDRMRVYITDNASTDGTGAYLAELAKTYPFPLHVQTLEVNTGAPIGLNFAIVRGDGALVARLDDDILLPADWLRPMVADFERRPWAGCIGPKVLNDDGNRAIQCAAYRHFPGLFGHEDEADLGQADYLARTVHVRGCCNLYRRDAFTRCGLLDPRFSPSQFDDPDHHIAMAVAGYEILYDGRVSIVHKLNNGLARSQAALSNQQGNAMKMYGKWSPDIFEVLEKSIDLSREGRYLPEDGDASGLLLGAPAPAEFPRMGLSSVPSATGPDVYEALARAHALPELNALAEDYLKAAAARLRDGFPRHALDILHAAANFAPHQPAVFLALAEAYSVSGQSAMARTMARRGLHLDPAHVRLKALADPAPTGAPAVVVRGRAGRPNDRSDVIGEAGVSVNDRAGGADTAPRMRVLMVNSFESRVAGGDMHQLKKTRQYLEALGVQVDVCCTPRPDPRGYDLVHLWNTWFPHQTLAQAKAIRALAPGIPIVLSTIYWDMKEKAWADLAVPELFSGSSTPEELEQRLQALAEDRFLINGRRRSEAGEPNYRGYELYQRRLFGMVDHLLPQSRAEVRNLDRTLGVTLPHTLVFNGAETTLFDRATPDWFVEQYKVRDFVLTVGLVEPRKNQLMLLHALRDTGLPVVVVGRNYDRNYLRLCRRYGGRKAIFIEHLPHEHLASAFRAARVHALPSWMECAAFVNVEAALSGCALAVSDRTSEREYFGDNAYYCDPAKIGSIRDAVVKACRNHAADAPKRAALREQFRNRFTWPQAAAQTLRGYEAALAARQATKVPASAQPQPTQSRPVTVAAGIDLPKAPVPTPTPTPAKAEATATATAPTPVATPSPEPSAPVVASAPSMVAEPAGGAAPVAPVPAVDRGGAQTGPVPVSIIIPVFNRLDLTRQCLARISENTPAGMAEVLVVDNGSTDGTSDFLAAEHAAGRLVHVRNTGNLGFARACNQGACLANGRQLLFLNNDTEVQPGWIQPMLDLLENDPRIAAVGSRLLYADGTIQHAGVALGELPGRDPLLAVHTYHRAPADLPAANQRRIYQALTAACLLVRRSDFEAVQGFDEEFWNGYEDVDLCLRMQDRGGWMVYEPASVVIHHESQSGPARFEKAGENVARLHRRWLGVARPRRAPGRGRPDLHPPGLGDPPVRIPREANRPGPPRPDVHPHPRPEPASADPGLRGEHRSPHPRAARTDPGRQRVQRRHGRVPRRSRSAEGQCPGGVQPREPRVRRGQQPGPRPREGGCRRPPQQRYRGHRRLAHPHARRARSPSRDRDRRSTLEPCGWTAVGGGRGLPGFGRPPGLCRRLGRPP
jgi:GT2 family glycosyltransferase